MRKFFLTCLMMTLCVVLSNAAQVSVLEAGGWFESAYVTWSKTAGLDYNVYVKASTGNSWSKLDNELVREYPTYGRADALGLKAGSYVFKVVPVSNGSEVTADAKESDVVTVKAHDRSGFAHVGMSAGIGAYKNDGTLKDGARVVYVWADNAKTVTCDVITNSKGGTTTGQGLQDIVYLYQKGYDTTPLAIRIIGTVKAEDMDRFDSSAEGLQVKGNGNYSEMNITFEGVGNDATLWGFGILCRNAKSVEFRNFAIMLCMDDALSLDTGNSNVWVHNMDFFYGNTGGDADQAKGDGTVDIKGKSKNITVSYNHFWDCGKTSLGGMKSETTDCWMTYHHNWFDHSDSRHPRIRTAFYHVYNNYFDGVSKYGVGVTMGGSAFVENNYFRNTKYPMLISKQGTDAEGDGTFSGEAGGVIKAYNNKIDNPKKVQYWSSAVQSSGAWDAVLVDDRSAAVSATAFSGGTSYNSSADNAARTTYMENHIDAPDNVKAVVTDNVYGAGRMQHGDFNWTFDNATQDENYGVIVALKTSLRDYQSTLVGFFGGDEISNGGADKTVDGGDNSSNDDYTPEWGGSTSGGTTTAGEFVIGSSKEYFWFNGNNQTAYNNYVTAGTFTTTGSFNPNQIIVKSDKTSCSDYIGSVRLAQNQSFTIYYPDGISSAYFYVSGSGSQEWKLETSDDNRTWTQFGENITGKSATHPSCSITLTEAVKYVRITNVNSSTRDLQGVKIASPKEVNPDADPVDEEEESSLSSDASADFTLNEVEIPMSGNAYTLNVAYDMDDANGYVVGIVPAEGATITAEGATATPTANNTYHIAAPIRGETATATFRILAENKSNTRTYTINIMKGVDPSTLPVSIGEFLYFPDGSKTYNTFFTVSGNTSNAKGSGSYTRNGETYNCNYTLKIESSTSIKFTPVKDGTLKIGYSGSGASNIKVNDVKSTETSIAVTAGTPYTLTKADVAYLLYLDLVYSEDGGEEPSEPSSVTGEVPFIATTTNTGFDYYWFNKENEDEVNAWISDGTIKLTKGASESSFKPESQPQSSDKKLVSEKTGTLEIGKAKSSADSGDGTPGSAIFYCPNGAKEFKLYMFRTGTYNFHVYKSTDNQQWTEIGSDTKTGKGKLEVSYAEKLNTTEPVYVKIENTSTGGLNIQGVIITYEKSMNVVKTATSGWTSLVSAHALDLANSGLKAYIATNVDKTGNKILLTEVQAVPANTPVLLKGEPSTDYTITTVDAVDRLNDTNLLAGSATESTYLAEATAYILSQGKFYLNQAGTMPAGKAYLPASMISKVSNAHELSIVIGEDATGINKVFESQNSNDKIYDLNGRLVLSPTKGVFIINGKKVYMK